MQVKRAQGLVDDVFAKMLSTWLPVRHWDGFAATCLIIEEQIKDKMQGDLLGIVGKK